MVTTPYNLRTVSQSWVDCHSNGPGNCLKILRCWISSQVERGLSCALVCHLGSGPVTPIRVVTEGLRD